MPDIFTDDIRWRYLDLLKHTLTGYIHIDHELANLRSPDWTTKQSLRHRVFRGAVVGALKPFGLVPMGRAKKDRRSRRALGKDWPVAGETMIGLRRLEAASKGSRNRFEGRYSGRSFRGWRLAGRCLDLDAGCSNGQWRLRPPDLGLRFLPRSACARARKPGG